MTHRVFGLPCPPVFRYPSFLSSNCSRVFTHRRCFLIIEQTVENIQKRLKATIILLLLVGCKQALLRARGVAGRVFRTCGVGVGGALWRVAFVCGPILIGLQGTCDKPSDFEIYMPAVTSTCS